MRTNQDKLDPELKIEGLNQEKLDRKLKRAIEAENLPGVQAVLEAGANVNALYSNFHSRCRSYVNPMGCAALAGNLQIIELLKEKGGRLRGGYDEKEGLVLSSPIHLATKVGHLHVVKFLHESGVDIHDCDVDLTCECHDNSDLLLYAAQYEQLRIVPWLLANKKSLSVEAEEMLLGLAASMGDLVTLRALQENGANLARPLEDRCCALCAAVNEDQLPAIKWLSEAGLKIDCALLLSIELDQADSACYLISRLIPNGRNLDIFFDSAGICKSLSLEAFNRLLGFIFKMYPFCLLSPDNKLNVKLLERFKQAQDFDVSPWADLLRSRMGFAQAISNLFNEKPDLKEISDNFMQGLQHLTQYEKENVDLIFSEAYSLIENHHIILNLFLKAFLVIPCDRDILLRNKLLAFLALKLHQDFNLKELDEPTREARLKLSMLCLFKIEASSKEALYLTNLSYLIERHTKQNANGMSSSKLFRNHSADILEIVKDLADFYVSYTKGLPNCVAISEDVPSMFDHVRARASKEEIQRLRSLIERSAASQAGSPAFFNADFNTARKRARVERFAGDGKLNP